MGISIREQELKICVSHDGYNKSFRAYLKGDEITYSDTLEQLIVNIDDMHISYDDLEDKTNGQ